MGLKLIPLGQGLSEKEYYVRFEGSMYGMLHVDNTAHTVSLVPLKKLNNVPVFVEPLDPYKLCGVRVFDSSSFRQVLCFFDRFYVTVGDIGALWLCDFSPVDEGVNPGQVSALDRVLCKLWREVDGSLTLEPARSHAICDKWGENNCSTGSWRLTSVCKHTTS